MKLPLLKRPDPSATGETAAVKKKRPALKKLGRKKLIALVAAAALVIGLGSHALLGGSAQAAKKSDGGYTTAQVTRRDVTATITGSGTLEAADSYNVTTLLEDTILTANFEEGGTDDCLFLPYSVAERMAGSVNAYTVTMQDEDHMDESVNALESALYEVFASDDYYTVTSMAEMLDTMTGMINILVYVLAGIAAISLVVGGIGIMNIMLVSVTERTREIGIRKSLGAKERYIMQQFVIEAAMTSALGGVIGILLGYVLSTVATRVVTQVMEASLTVAPTFGAVALAFGISVGIGILFGYLPARKAAALNPIDALHYD